MDRKLNRAEAGYHMLQLLSDVDGSFSSQEERIISDYLAENKSDVPDMKSAADFLSALSREDYIIHFQKCMEDFYQDSTHQERVQFMNFAVQLVKADATVSVEENKFLKTLYDMWESETA